MKKMIVKCPYCEKNNQLFPSKKIDIDYLNCINCGKLRPLVLYDLQLPLDHQQYNEKDAQE